MTLQEAISKDIQSLTNGDKFKSFLDEVDVIYQADFRASNKGLVNPDGTSREDLNEKYKKTKKSVGAQPVPDFYFKGTAENTFSSSTSATSIEYGYPDPKVAKYMLGHEVGDTRTEDGGVRRQFPIESDMFSSRQQDNIKSVEEALTRHLNMDRKITVNG